LVGRPEGKRLLGRPRSRWEDDITMDLQEMRWSAWSGFTWLRIRTGGGLLWMRQWNFGFHKMRRISCLAEELLAFSRTPFHGVAEITHNGGEGRMKYKRC
jgi:hypothetical protein